ncbi:hypothetical protein P9112_003026 [Eukaryota sp. TZLM1-RC]
MTSLSGIIKSLEIIYPRSLSEDWDIQDPLQVGDTEANITKILVALDVRDEVIDEAIQIGADLILTHHPFIFKPIKSITSTDPLARRIMKMIRHNIACVCYHTSADSAIGGLNDFLAFQLGLDDLRPILPSDSTNDELSTIAFGNIKLPSTQLELPLSKGMFFSVDDSTSRCLIYGESDLKNQLEPLYSLRAGLGRRGEFKEEKSVNEVVTMLRTTFEMFLGSKHVQPIRVAGSLEKKVKKIGICSGSGSSLLPKVTDCDLFITGDVGFHHVQAAVDSDVVIVDATHWNTEGIYEEVFAERIKSLVNVEVVRSEFKGDLFINC